MSWGVSYKDGLLSRSVPAPGAWAPSPSKSHSSFCVSSLRRLRSQTPPPSAFLEGRRGQLPPCPGLQPWSGPCLQGGWLDLAAGMWEMGPRAIFAKATKLKAGPGRLGPAVCSGGSAGLRDAFFLLGPERDIVPDSSDEEHIFQTNSAAGPGASPKQGRQL